MQPQPILSRARIFKRRKAVLKGISLYLSKRMKAPNLDVFKASFKRSVKKARLSADVRHALERAIKTAIRFPRGLSAKEEVTLIYNAYKIEAPRIIASVFNDTALLPRKSGTST